MNERALIAELVRRQGSESDARFAARFGVTRMAWRHVKSGDLRLGRKMLQGIGHAYPDLVPHIALLFAPSIDSIPTNMDSKATEPAR